MPLNSKYCLYCEHKTDITTPWGALYSRCDYWTKEMGLVEYITCSHTLEPLEDRNPLDFRVLSFWSCSKWERSKEAEEQLEKACGIFRNDRNTAWVARAIVKKGDTIASVICEAPDYKKVARALADFLQDRTTLFYGEKEDEST